MYSFIYPWFREQNLFVPFASNVHGFPVVFWLAIAIEDKSLEVSRRCMKLGVENLERRFVDVYRAHFVEENGHITTDSRVLEFFHKSLSTRKRHRVAGWFKYFLNTFMFTPGNAAKKTVVELINEFEDLKPLRSKMLSELASLKHCQEFRDMMYSRKSTPNLYRLFDLYPEMSL